MSRAPFWLQGLYTDRDSPEPAYMRAFRAGEHNAEDRIKIIRTAGGQGRRIFLVDCGQMPPTRIQTFLKEIMERYKDK